MARRQIYITKFDLQRLKKKIEAVREYNDEKELPHAEELDKELDRANVLEPQDIPDDVITMNSTVSLRDLDSGDEMEYTLVFPKAANAVENNISILAPVGAAMLGCRVGDVIEWKVPKGIRRLKVNAVVYQPEASGDFHL